MDTILLVTMETATFRVPACFQIREQLPLHPSGFYLMNGSLFENERLTERKRVDLVPNFYESQGSRLFENCCTTATKL